MTSHLKLVMNTDLAPAAFASLLVRNFPIRNLTISRQQPGVDMYKQKISNLMLGLVVLVHLAGLAWLASVKPTPPITEVQVQPMTVSLVSSPAPEPEVVPLLPAPPQPDIKKPVINKQRQIVKQQSPKPIATETEVTKPVAVSEAPPSPATPVVVGKAEEVTEPPIKQEIEPVIEPPRFGAAYLHNPAPTYPPLSRRLGEQGRVLLRVLVSTVGDADNVQMESSSGSNRLDQVAIQAVKKWRFIPAKRSNQAISAYVLVPVKFSLEN